MMRCYLSIVFSFLVPSLQAQVDSISKRIYQTPEVVVGVERGKNFSVGQRITYTDSASVNNRLGYSLAEQLTNGNAIFIKSYGGNGLATLSLQGSSDVHAAVLWNGFNLQSTMNGTVDLSVLPTFFIDEIGVQSGSASHLWGSGAVGGSVLLNNKPRFSSGLQIKTGSEIGSYGQFRQQLKLGYGTKKWYGNVRGYYSQARNDYPATYIEQTKAPLGHAATEQKGVLAENYFQWKNKNQITARLWLQDDMRQNPNDEQRGTLFQNFRRANVEYERQEHFHKIIVRNAWMREDLLFVYPLLKQDTRSLADVLTNEAEWNWNPSKRHHFDIGLNNTYQQAIVDVFDYGSTGEIKGPHQNKYLHTAPNRNRVSLFGLYKYKSINEVFVAQISGRKEWTTSNKIPLVPAVGLEVRPIKSILIRASGSRMYRIPTFNELYWDPGGNPSILPESGWSMELSSKWTEKIQKTGGYYEFIFFNRHINNWIRWIPIGPVWYAQNVANVWTRGFEHKLGAIQEIGKSRIQLKVSWMYVISTNTQSGLTNDASLDQQLLFTPMYQGNGNISYAYKGFYVEYNHTYVGYNYISSDHSSWLDPFQLGNLVVSQTIPFKKVKSSFVFRVNNLWNAQYRTLAAYPMPPRNFQASLQFEFIHSKVN